ncbi:MAG: aminoacyl-tRNA hydrolase [Pseudomonadota bacterium]
MQLYVGLGNPGAKYAANRHNIGFMALDAIAAREGAPAWRSKFQGALTEIRLGGRKIALLKPQTFMNDSGRSVGAAARFFGLGAEDVTVFHDELDLAPGRLRTKRGGGHAGHNGLRSIHAHLGADYRRVRLGIGHPGHKDRVAGYVLHDFPKADLAWVEPLIDAVARAVVPLAEGADDRFQSEVARLAPAPGKPARGPAPPAVEPGDGRAAQSRDGRGAQEADAGAGHDESAGAASGSPFAALRGLFKR